MKIIFLLFIFCFFISCSKKGETNHSKMQADFQKIKTIVDELTNHQNLKVQADFQKIKTIVDELTNHQNSKVQADFQKIKTIIDELTNHQNSKVQADFQKIKTIVDELTNHQNSKVQVKFQKIKTAVAILQPTEGNQTKGKVFFYQTPKGVKVVATVVNLLPNSKHGFHIHQFGDISKKDGTSAGGHFNPDGHSHKLPEETKMRHAGDMGNLVANEKGIATFEKIFNNFSLDLSKKNCIIGRAVIIHLKKDDGTGATGNAGARISMGVIGITQIK